MEAMWDFGEGGRCSQGPAPWPFGTPLGAHSYPVSLPPPSPDMISLLLTPEASEKKLLFPPTQENLETQKVLSPLSGQLRVPAVTGMDGRHYPMLLCP